MRIATTGVLTCLTVLTACGDPSIPVGKPRLLSVSAQGRAIGTPDATRFTVTTRKIEPTAEAALKSTSTTMAAIVAKLKEAGVADAEISGKSAAVAPNNECRPVPRAELGQPHQICEQKGFKSQQVMSILVRDLAKAGSLMGLAVASGAEEMQGGEAFFGDPEKMHSLARGNAIEVAQAKARLYADKLGLRLGPVLAVTDDPLMLPGLHRELAPQASAADLGGGPDIPVEPGQRILSKTLYVIWEVR